MNRRSFLSAFSAFLAALPFSRPSRAFAFDMSDKLDLTAGVAAPAGRGYTAWMSHGQAIKTHGEAVDYARVIEELHEHSASFSEVFRRPIPIPPTFNG